MQSKLDEISRNIKKTYDVKIIAYPDQSKRGYINMEKIVASSPGSGNGTKALHKFIALSKKAGFKGITISVLPLNGFSMTTEQEVNRLANWYMRQGFVLTRTSPVIQMEFKFK